MTNELPADEYVLEHAERKLKRVHSEKLCKGRPCTVHTKTDHSMRSFPQNWRDDIRIMERVCPHNVGHPDPDEWALQTGTHDGTHGCDGCCVGAYEVKND